MAPEAPGYPSASLAAAAAAGAPAPQSCSCRPAAAAGSPSPLLGTDLSTAGTTHTTQTALTAQQSAAAVGDLGAHSAVASELGFPKLPAVELTAVPFAPTAQQPAERAADSTDATMTDAAASIVSSSNKTCAAVDSKPVVSTAGSLAATAATQPPASTQQQVPSSSAQVAYSTQAHTAAAPAPGAPAAAVQQSPALLQAPCAPKSRRTGPVDSIRMPALGMMLQNSTTNVRVRGILVGKGPYGKVYHSVDSRTVQAAPFGLPWGRIGHLQTVTKVFSKTCPQLRITTEQFASSSIWGCIQQQRLTHLESRFMWVLGSGTLLLGDEQYRCLVYTVLPDTSLEQLLLQPQQQVADVLSEAQTLRIAKQLLDAAALLDEGSALSSSISSFNLRPAQLFVGPATGGSGLADVTISGLADFMLTQSALQLCAATAAFAPNLSSSSSAGNPLAAPMVQLASRDSAETAAASTAAIGRGQQDPEASSQSDLYAVGVMLCDIMTHGWITKQKQALKLAANSNSNQQQQDGSSAQQQPTWQQCLEWYLEGPAKWHMLPADWQSAAMQDAWSFVQHCCTQGMPAAQLLQHPWLRAAGGVGSPASTAAAGIAVGAAAAGAAVDAGVLDIGAAIASDRAAAKIQDEEEALTAEDPLWGKQLGAVPQAPSGGLLSAGQGADAAVSGSPARDQSPEAPFKRRKRQEAATTAAVTATAQQQQPQEQEQGLWGLLSSFTSSSVLGSLWN